MTTPFVELYINQGTDFNHVIYLSDDVTNDVLDVSGFTVTSQLRRSHYSQNASANITCTVTNGTEGEITLHMSADTTSGLKPGRYVFDVKTIDSVNTVSRILEGIITVTPSVTR